MRHIPLLSGFQTDGIAAGTLLQAVLRIHCEVVLCFSTLAHEDAVVF